MVSQFVSPDKVRLLADLGYNFPEGTHALGRLDNHSEGLLVLTTNKKMTRLLFQSATPHKRTYLVQVNRKVSPENLAMLQNGVAITIHKGEQYLTPPCDVQIVTKPANLPPSSYPDRDDIPSTWLLITLTEGKYHQVRKMVSAVRHPCRRLIRVAIEDLLLGDMQPGEVREMNEEDIFRLLKLEKE